MSKTALWIIIILLLVIITGGFYWYLIADSDVDSQNDNEKVEVQEDESESDMEAPLSESPDVLPQDVVDQFMKATLGTLPGAEVDYDKAKSYMTAELKSYYTGDYWVPEFYGIQQGPDSFVTTDVNVVDDSATVKVTPAYGDSDVSWAFILKKVDNEWKISEFKNDAQ